MKHPHAFHFYQIIICYNWIKLIIHPRGSLSVNSTLIEWRSKDEVPLRTDQPRTPLCDGGFFRHATICVPAARTERPHFAQRPQDSVPKLGRGESSRTRTFWRRLFSYSPILTLSPLFSCNAFRRTFLNNWCWIITKLCPCPSRVASTPRRQLRFAWPTRSTATAWKEPIVC